MFTRSSKRLLAILSGLLLSLFMLWVNPFHLDIQAARVLAVGVLMISWWVTEAMPMPAVALLPLVLFPLLGIARLDAVAVAYANPVIFLFLGGFLIGLAIEKWMLHKRIALNIVRVTGTSGNRIVLGFIIATGFISMWLSNTATTMMMYPIALSVITVLERANVDETGQRNLAVCLLLAVAYASNIGGIATIIGTPPNVAYVAFLEKHNGYAFSFAEWMRLCLPLSVLLLLALYLVMVRFLYPTRIGDSPATRVMIAKEVSKLGTMSAPERRVLGVFVLTATLWITKDLINAAQQAFRLDDSMIAVAGALLLFIIPSGVPGSADDKPAALLEWPDTQRMAWGILLLFGGGIALASQLEAAGLVQRLGKAIAGSVSAGFLLVLVITLVSIFISEVMSNVAQVIVFAPVVAGMAEGLDMNPLQLGLAMTLGASCAGMLPMGTPPNAIVFASGRLKLRHMVLTGLVMNLVAALLITLFCWYLVPLMITSAGG